MSVPSDTARGDITRCSDWGSQAEPVRLLLDDLDQSYWRTSNSTPERRPKSIENKCSKKSRYPNVHSSTVHSSQKMKTTWMSIDGWRGNKMWYIHTMGYYPAMMIVTCARPGFHEELWLLRHSWPSVWGRVLCRWGACRRLPVAACNPCHFLGCGNIASISVFVFMSSSSLYVSSSKFLSSYMDTERWLRSI